MNPRTQGIGPIRQRGASSLFIIVILVLVLMLLAVTAAVLSSTQFRLAGNLQYENIAFNRAEGALASAENWLSSTDVDGAQNSKNSKFEETYSTGHLYPIGNNIDPLTMTWTDSNSLKLDADGTQRYLIEKYGRDNQPLGTDRSSGVVGRADCERVDVFRISTRGASVRGTTKLVQTIYSVRSC